MNGWEQYEKVLPTFHFPAGYVRMYFSLHTEEITFRVVVSPDICYSLFHQRRRTFPADVQGHCFCRITVQTPLEAINYLNLDTFLHARNYSVSRNTEGFLLLSQCV